MNLVYVNNNRPVTDSLTVSESFGKEHRRVMQDIRELGCSEQFRLHHFVLTPYVNEQNGQTYEKCLMTEQGFALLAFGYTGQKAMKFKEDFINEFENLKLKLNKPQLPSSYIEALEALLDTSKENLALQQQAQLNAPKVALYDVAMCANNNQSISKVAKSLGYGPNKLFKLLKEKKILMQNNTPYQRYIDSGYFDLRIVPITRTDSIMNVTQPLVTAKGVAWLHNLIQSQQQAN